MKYIKLKKKYHAIIFTMGLSLLLHFVLATLLLFGLSNNLISSPKLNGLNLVWVSLDNKIKNGSIEYRKSLIKQSSPAIERMADKKTHMPGNKQIYSTATGTLTNVMTLGKYDTSGNGSADKFDEMNGNSSNKNAGGTSNSNTVIAYPLYKENTPPAYPEIARVRGYEGMVLVFAEILPNGHVGEVKIRKSSGYAVLDQSAIQAVKPWKFEPAKKSGDPFTAWIELPIKFILNKTQS